MDKNNAATIVAKTSAKDGEYAALRAKRRARSKATIIGRFANAKAYLDEGKTISGFTDSIDAMHQYLDAFIVVLHDNGHSSAEDYSKLLSHANGYQSIDEFVHDDEIYDNDQEVEVATFMLILYDRLIALINTGGNATSVFSTTVQLEACYRLIYSDTPTQRASYAAFAKHEKDPKQADKVLVRECWDEWQKQPDRYSGKAAFARDMRDKFENLKSQPVIEGWCRGWERET